MSDQTFLDDDEQEEGQNKKFRIGDVKAFLFLLKKSKGQYPSLLLGLVIIFIASILVIFSGKWMGELIQDGLIKKDWNRSFILCGQILVFESFSLFLTYKGSKILIKSSNEIILQIRAILFAHFQVLPLSYFDRQPQGRIITRLTHDVEGLESFFVGSLTKLMNGFFMLSVSIIFILATDIKVGSTIVLSLLPAILFIFLTKGKIKNINRQMSKCTGFFNSKLSELIDGIDVIRVFGLEKWAREAYIEKIDLHKKSTLNANLFYGITRPIVMTLIYLPFFGLLWFGGKAVLGGTLLIGTFVALMRYCEKFFNPLMTLATEIQVIQEAFSKSERVASFLKHETEEEELGHDGNLTSKILGKIEFKNVIMSYPQNNELILKNVSFNIDPGEKVGFVGRTGSGKTTTISLLSRLYEFQQGEILIDNQCIRDFKRSHLRRNIGLVSQDVIVFKGSILENLIMEENDKNFSKKFLKSVCDKTGLTDVLKNRGIGPLDYISESGNDLSGGEKQLLSLARVVLRNPSILILDEATSNFDFHFENLIHQFLTENFKGITQIYVAHRLETLGDCDKIMVFNEGKIVEQGTPSQLMENKKYFFDLKYNQSEPVNLD